MRLFALGIGEVLLGFVPLLCRVNLADVRLETDTVSMVDVVDNSLLVSEDETGKTSITSSSLLLMLLVRVRLFEFRVLESESLIRFMLSISLSVSFSWSFRLTRWLSSDPCELVEPLLPLLDEVSSSIVIVISSRLLFEWLAVVVWLAYRDRLKRLVNYLVLYLDNIYDDRAQ